MTCESSLLERDFAFTLLKESVRKNSDEAKFQNRRLCQFVGFFDRRVLDQSFEKRGIAGFGDDGGWNKGIPWGGGNHPDGWADNSIATFIMAPKVLRTVSSLITARTSSATALDTLHINTLKDSSRTRLRHMDLTSATACAATAASSASASASTATATTTSATAIQCCSCDSVLPGRPPGGHPAGAPRDPMDRHQPRFHVCV